MASFNLRRFCSSFAPRSVGRTVDTLMGAGFIRLLLIIIVYLLASIRVLRQYERGVVFFLGKFEGVRGRRLTLLFVRSSPWCATRCAL